MWPRRFPFFRRRQTPAPEKPLRDELLSVERLDERAKSLAGQFTIAFPTRRTRCAYPRLVDNARVLRATYDALADDVAMTRRKMLEWQTRARQPHQTRIASRASQRRRTLRRH